MLTPNYMMWWKKQPPEVRSSHQRCSIWKGVLRNFIKFTGKHLCQSLFFNKVAGLRPKDNFFKNTFFTEHLWTTASEKCFYEKGVLENFAKFTGKHLCWSLVFNKETPAQVLSCEFVTLFWQNSSWRLFLEWKVKGSDNLQYS